jgi:RNA polymerase sigma factor (sigma-70 family)
MGTVLQQLDSALAMNGATDQQLLERFARTQDQDAFAVLVKRYAGLVMGACRRLLGNTEDAEDVFQAVFLVLARRAAAVRWRASIGGWIYEVASRLALKARAESLRRRGHETQGIYPMDQAEAKERLASRELCAALDEELSRLPEKLRTPLALVYLDGQAREKVAFQLGYSERTLKRRLAQAKRLLRGRFEKRGLTLSATLLTVGISSSLAEARVPASLLRAATKSAAAFCSGEGIDQISPRVVDFATRMLKGIAISKTHVCLVVAVALGIVSAGAGLGARQLARAKDDRGNTFAQSAPRASQEASPEGKGNSASHVDRYGDPLPPGAIARLGTIRMRHGGLRGSGFIAFSRDGRSLISRCDDGIVHFWDPTTLRELRSFRTGCYCPMGIDPVSLSGDQKLLAAGDPDHSVHLYETATGKELRRFGTELRQTAQCVALTPDGRTLATAHSNRFVHVWDAATGKELLQFEAHEGMVYRLQFTPDGKTLATVGGEGATSDPEVRLWRADTGKLVHKLTAPKSSYFPFAFSADGKTIAVPDGAALQLYDVVTGQIRKRFDSGVSVPTAVAISVDGRTVAVAGPGELHVFDMSSGRMKQSPKVPAYREHRLASLFINHLTFSPDGKLLAASGAGRTVHLFEVATGKELDLPAGHDGEVRSVAFSPDGKTVATGSTWEGDDTIRLWNAASGRPLWVAPGANAEPQKLLFTRDGARVVSSHWDGMRLWDAATGKAGRFLAADPVRNEDKLGVIDIAIAPDDSLFSFSIHLSRGTALVKRWNLSNGQRTLEHEQPPAEHAHYSAFSADGRLLARPGPQAAVYDALTGDRVALLKSDLPVEQVLFSQDGRILVGATEKPRPMEPSPLIVWELASGKEIRQFSPTTKIGPGGGAFGLSPNGKVLAWGGLLGTPIELRDITTGAELQTLSGHRASVMALAFSPDGARLASGLSDTSVLLWDVVAATATTARKLARSDLDRLWQDLASDDAAKGQAAVWGLLAAPQATAFLRGRLRPVPEPDRQHVEKLIANLDHKSFAVRTGAYKELEGMGSVVQPALRKALERPVSQEVRQRLQDLVTAVPHVLSGDALRNVRAIQALEALGSDGTRDILAAVAKGAAAARETREAAASLERLAKRLAK